MRAIALEQARIDGTPYEVQLPESCVLYLRDEPKAPDTLNCNVRLPDGQCFTYHAKAVRIPRYSLDEIFEKRLFFFLPYYIMRYEKELDLIEQDNDRLAELEAEFQSIREKLKISNYVLQEQKQTKEGVVNTMGGQILELPSDKLKEEHAKGRAEGALDMAQQVYRKCLARGMSEEEAREISGLQTADAVLAEA